MEQGQYQKIREIEIHTTQLANDFLAGAWHSAFKGRGMEFEEVREYQQGDEIRTIDWNVTARMRHPYVKVFREERELTVVLLVDHSASTQFGSRQKLKQELIAEVGALLAFSAIKNNDKVGLLLFTTEVELYIPPKKGKRHVLRVIRELLAFEAEHRGTSLEKALNTLGNVLKKSAIVFLISDFLSEIPEHELNLLAKKHDLIAIAVNDPAEETFPSLEVATVSDLESGEIIITDTETSTKIQPEKRNVQRLMQKIGGSYLALSTGEPYLKPLQLFFKQRKILH